MLFIKNDPQLSVFSSQQCPERGELLQLQVLLQTLEIAQLYSHLASSIPLAPLTCTILSRLVKVGTHLTTPILHFSWLTPPSISMLPHASQN